MKTYWIVAFVAAGFASPLAAQQGQSYLDGFGIVKSDAEAEVVDLGSSEDEGDGYGVKAQLGLGGVFLTGEYQSVEYDDTELKLDQIRGGLELGPGAGNGSGLYAGGEFVRFTFDYPDVSDDDEEDQDGFGGHIGFALGLSPTVRLYGQAGYVKLDDIDGPEYLAGLAVQLLPNLGLFADYRATDLEDDDENELSFDDVRVGARFYF